MRFDHFDSLWAITGDVVGALQSLSLTFRYRCVDALRAAVRTRANTSEYSVDTIAIPFGIVETLEGYHAQTFSQHGAICLIREGSAVTAWTEGWGLAEAHEHEDVVEGVDAAGDDEI